MGFVPWVAAAVIYLVLFMVFRSRHRHDLICVHDPEDIDYSVCIGCNKEFLDLPATCFYSGAPHTLEQDV